MNSTAYGDWVARGRSHQWAGRPIDALLCFRRALRETPEGLDALFHLGEVLWQIGRLQEAVSAWKQAIALAPDFLPALQALAEALLGLGDATGAREISTRVIALVSNDERARWLAALSALTLAEPRQDSPVIGEVASLLARAPALLAVPAIGGSLARTLQRRPRHEIMRALVDVATDVSLVAAWPATLLALACEQWLTEVRASAVAEGLFATTLARTLSAADHDALRRIALAAVRGHVAQAAALTQLYARLCASEHAVDVPLLWPLRTAGAQLRVIALVASDLDDAAAADLLAALATDDQVAIALAVFGDTDDVARLPGALAQFPRIPLPPVPGLADARRIAALDPDFLIDLVGLDHPTGPLLAARPARIIVSIASLVAPNALPLLDRSCVNASELLQWLATGPVGASSTADAQTLTAWWSEAVAMHKRGDGHEARLRYEQILHVQPGSPSALYLLGVVLREGRDMPAALQCFRMAFAAAPRYADAQVAALDAAGALRDADSVHELCASLDRASSPLPLLRAAGAAALALRDGAVAQSWFDAAVLREPTDGETQYNLGVALQMQQRQADAARAYQRALTFSPDLLAADFNLGVIFQQLGNSAPAISAFTNVLARDPTHVAAYKSLGELLLAAGQIDTWLANFRRFEVHCPDALPLAVQALEACHYLADFAKLDSYLDGLRNERFKVADELELADCLEQLLYLLLYFDVDPEMLHRFATTYDQTARHVYGAPLPCPPARRPGKLRIGYLSGDLRNHVMGKMIWQAVQYHDRERFALYFYSLSGQRDSWTERFAGIADRFDMLGHLDERAAADHIATDDLDVLVDLSTHTKGAKPGILARKPARVQITHVASSGTVGLSTIDFKLTDAHADVPENQATQIETLLPMAGCVYPYRHIEAATTHPFHRANLGIAPDTVVIGVFVSALKLSRRCLDLWRKVLERIPRARLAFSPVNPALRPLYARLANATGIPTERLMFLPQGRDDAENQARYALVDFVLDPMPYGGVNGTLEALDAGVPVVTLVGKRHAERTSYSILMNAGVTQTIAEGGREYVDIAVRLAEDLAFMSEVRNAIRAGMSNSPLVDMRAHTRHLEAAYLEALQRVAPDALASAVPASMT